MSRRRAGERGQSLPEFCLVLTTLMVMVLGIAELGFAFSNNMSLELATREGARVGAALVAGKGHPENVDPQIIAAVERALRSPGSGIELSKIAWIHIYQAKSDGSEGAFNEWRYSAGGGPLVDGQNLDFYESSVGWPATARSATLPPPSIGVSIQYTHDLKTPIGAISSSIFGTSNIGMVDRTVMALEP